MDKQKYIEMLEKQNGYCKCSEMQDLYSKKRKKDGLVNQCHYMNAEVDLENPREDDKDYLLEYKKKAIKMNEVYNNYLKELNRYINDEILELILHKEDNFEKRKINKSELEEKLSEGKIITANCRSCEQQVDVLD